MSVMQILAGNARKVSAVRFERVNHDDATLESKEVTRLVPKIMKRKWSSSEIPYQKTAEDLSDDDLSDGSVNSDHEYDHEHPSEQ